MASHDWNDTLEVVSAAPQLAIKCNFRQVSYPFWRCIDLVTIPCIHDRAIPITTDTVKFLTHQPSRWIISSLVICLGKHYINWAGAISYITTKYDFINFFFIVYSFGQDSLPGWLSDAKIFRLLLSFSLLVSLFCFGCFFYFYLIFCDWSFSKHFWHFTDGCWFLNVMFLFMFFYQLFKFRNSTNNVRLRDLLTWNYTSVLVIRSFRNSVIVHDAVGNLFVEVFELFSEFVGTRFNTCHF